MKRYILLTDNTGMCVHHCTHAVAFELPAGVSSVTGPASEHRNPQHVAEWQGIVVARCVGSIATGYSGP